MAPSRKSGLIWGIPPSSKAGILLTPFMPYSPIASSAGRVWNEQGDFMEMGDDEIPDYILDEPWEAPASIFSDTWGYRSWEKRSDLPGKTREHILRLVKVVSRGGNYILNIGPRGDGSVVEFEADVLRGTGEWLRRNSDAIYGTQPQPFRKLDFGYATVKGNRLFLFVENAPKDDALKLPGLQNQITRASLQGVPLKFENNTVFYTPHDSDVLPVVTIEFTGDLKVIQPAVPVNDDKVNLTQSTADRFCNSNGEGYWDPPRLRKEQWHFHTDSQANIKWKSPTNRASSLVCSMLLLAKQLSKPI